MIYDERIKGTKCEKCRYGRDYIVGMCLPLLCQNCKQRPRKFDVDNFTDDYRGQELRDILDEDARTETDADY